MGMKKYILILLTIACSSLAQTGLSQTIGYYNSKDLLLQMPEYRLAAVASKDAKAKRDKTLKELLGELETMRQEYLAEKEKLDEVMVGFKESELKDKADRIKKYEAASMQDIQKLEAEMLIPVHNKMGQALEKVILANNIDKHADLANPAITIQEGWIDLMPMLKKELGL